MKIEVKKKRVIRLNNSFYKKAATYSPAFAVPSALKGLTSLFGMVRGETFRYNHLKSLVLLNTIIFLTYSDKIPKTKYT